MTYKEFDTANLEPFDYEESYQILKQHFSLNSFPEKKEMYVCIGANGAGKSTLLANLYKNNIVDVPYINADIFQKECLINNTEEQDLQNKKAVMFVANAVDKLVAENKSFCFETVFSHPSKVELIKKAKEKGYKVVVFYVTTTDPKINIERVAKRVQEGGHNVPKEKIVERYYRCKAQIKKALPYCDHIYFFDNSKNLTKNREGQKIQGKEGQEFCL